MARPKIPVVKIKKLHEDAVVPDLATLGSAGFDLVATEKVLCAPNNRYVVGTGLAMAIPPGWEGQVRPRSGLAFKQGLTVLNAPGTIDADYRGEVKVIIYNTGPVHEIQPGDRIAQLLIKKVPKVKFEEVDELDETERGSGGFGSTGR